MADTRRLIERLPSLYRPEPGDGTLLTTFLDAVAEELAGARDACSMVMPAHWAQHADRAALDAWFAIRRKRAGLPALAPTDLIDFSDAQAVLIAVKDAHTPLTQHLKSELSAPLVAELDAWDDTLPPPIPLQRHMLDALNRRVRSAPLYDPARFAGITLSTDTIARAEANPVGAARTAVNVQLLLEAFPQQLRRAVLDLPWVRDLGRLGAILPVVPWREPAAARESAEPFRIRLARMVALYRNGLGTLGALRTVVEATLPLDNAAPPELRDAPFEIEEFAPLPEAITPIPTNGPPDQLVGPLMRWELDNPGLVPITPTIFITGLTPGAGIAATADPIIELYEAGSPRIGIGYDGTLAPDQTLRLRPSYATWTIGAAGLQRADHLPAPAAAADPTTPGTASDVADAPEDVVAFTHTPDGMLWVAADDGTTLARFDGSAWTEVATGLAAIRCFAHEDAALLLGTAGGLLRVPLFPEDGDQTPVAVAGFGSAAIRTIAAAHGGSRLIGTDTGLLEWNGSDAPDAVAIGGGAGISIAIGAIAHDGSGAVHVGSELGVFEYQPALDAWFWYSGEEFTEQQPEWQTFETAPDAQRVFLPEVLAVHRGRDAALWLGTEAGIARYVARGVGGATYTTVLEAFPDLGTGAITQIMEDERGGVWFCSERGLLRYDGRDWWQRRSGAWSHLGRADLLPGVVAQPRGAWRFNRASVQWQRFDERARQFVVPAIELRTTAEPAVSAVMISDTVAAELGAFDGSTFEPAEAVAADNLYLHIQPSEERVISGGMPYLPRIPVGKSAWRYLAREPGDLVPAAAEHRPAWSMEGRLFPPPPSLDAPYAGRFDITPPPDGHFDQSVFSFDPAAQVAFGFAPTQPCSVLVRLHRRTGEPSFDPAILDRVWEGIQLVRPAGVRARLAVDETIVRGS